MKFSADWLDHDDTRLLKKDLEEKKHNVVQRLIGAAGSSSDPKCAELAREYRTLDSFIKELSGDRNAKRTD